MNRLGLFYSALKKSKDALIRAPYMFPLQSVISQLEYLIQIENESIVQFEKGKLKTITIGQIAARDIDEFDSELANELHAVSAEVAKMLRGQ